MSRKNENLEATLSLVRQLASSLGNSTEYADLKFVLERVETHLMHKGDSERWANRLVNYIRFAEFNKQFSMNQEQKEIIGQLAAIGKYAGINGAYRTDYGDISQF